MPFIIGWVGGDPGYLATRDSSALHQRESKMLSPGVGSAMESTFPFSRWLMGNKLLCQSRRITILLYLIANPFQAARLMWGWSREAGKKSDVLLAASRISPGRQRLITTLTQLRPVRSRHELKKDRVWLHSHGGPIGNIHTLHDWHRALRGGLRPEKSSPVHAW